MNLSPNFTLEELEYSATAKKHGLDNCCPDNLVQKNLISLVTNVLQPVRDHFAKPVKVNSCYRGIELNKHVGGSGTSQHCKGEAADIEIMGLPNHELAEWIRDNLTFDQLILENYTLGEPNSGWVHVSYCRNRARQQVMTAIFKGKKPTYHPGLLV